MTAVPGPFTVGMRGNRAWKVLRRGEGSRYTKGGGVIHRLFVCLTFTREGQKDQLCPERGRGGVCVKPGRKRGNSDKPLQTMPQGGSKRSSLGNCRRSPLHLWGLSCSHSSPYPHEGKPAPRYANMLVGLCHLRWPYVNGGFHINSSGKHISD